MPKKDFYIKESELDQYQMQLLLKTLDESMVVSGCAGSGKSVIALHKAKQVQNEKGTDYQIVVFTKSLCRYMNSGKDELGLNNEFDYLYNWKKDGHPSSDFVIVDEIQDFTKEEIELIKGATKKHFFFFGDTAQSIYDGLKNTQDIIDIASEAKLLPFQLYFNYRLPKPIAKITENYIGVGTKYNEGTYKSSENNMPRIIKYANYDEQLKAVAKIIKLNKLDDVGIFFPHNEQVKEASLKLTSLGINNEVKYSLTGDWNCLLYTSPSPRDVEESRMPSSA